MTDPLVKAGIDEVSSFLTTLETLITDAVVQRVDHPALEQLRASYVAVQDLYNVFDDVRVRGSWDRDALSPEGERGLREAIDDLWGCIGKAEIDQLQEVTVRAAKANHGLLWHSDSVELEASPT